MSVFTTKLAIYALARGYAGPAILITIGVALVYQPGPIGEPSQTPAAYWFIGARPIANPDTLHLTTGTPAAGPAVGAAVRQVGGGGGPKAVRAVVIVLGCSRGARGAETLPGTRTGLRRQTPRRHRSFCPSL